MKLLLTTIVLATGLLFFSCNQKSKNNDASSSFKTLDSLGLLSIGKKIFQTDSVNKAGEIIWRREIKDFRGRLSYDSFFHTFPANVEEFDSAGIKKAIILFTTISWNEQQEVNGCHSCGAITSYALMTKNADEQWQVDKFYPGFEAGNWGGTAPITFQKYGANKIGLLIEGSFTQGGYIDQSFQLYDINVEKYIFNANETISTPDDKVDLEIAFSVDSSQSNKSYWPINIFLKGKDESDEVNKVEKYVFKEQIGEYLLEEK